MATGIWVPDSPPDPITIYVDETCLDEKSGLMHVGLPVLHSGEREFQKAVDLMRKEFPRFQHATFKAGKLDPSNAKVYTKFLKYVIKLLGLVGDGGELRAVVTVEAVDRSAGWERDFIQKELDRAFAEYKIESSVGREFARQAGWLRRNFDYLCNSPVQNPFRVIVDEKYRDAAECQSLKPTLSPALGIAVWMEHWKHLTFALNSVISITRKKKGQWLPRFTEFRFEKDENSIFLQAADLLANLFYNALRFEKGIRTENTRLKNDILRMVYDSPFEARLLDALWVKTFVDRTGQSSERLVLNDNSLSGRMTLVPYTLTNVETK